MLDQVRMKLRISVFNSSACRGISLVDLELALLQQIDRQLSRVFDRDHLIIIPVHQQDRNIDLLEVFGEVGFRKHRDAIVLLLYLPNAAAIWPTSVAQGMSSAA